MLFRSVSQSRYTANSGNVIASSAYDKSNAANSLAYNTGIGTNTFLLAVIAGANTDVGTGANTFLLSVIAGANTAVGAGANAFTSATIAGANTAVGAGANAFTSSTIAGANTAVGAGANAFTSATIAGANTISSAAFDKANSANIVASAAFGKANTVVATITGTTNQITVSGTTAVTLSTPQGIGTTSNTQFNSLGIGTTASGTAGTIRATNDITAFYSDRRLKEGFTLIPYAVEKIMSLNGVFFWENEIARNFGYSNPNRQVGVIAQEIQTVLPEAVTLAPFDTEYVDGKETSKSGEHYLTVKYEKIIPLLIEAIKEQQREIDDLKRKIGS